MRWGNFRRRGAPTGAGKTGISCIDVDEPQKRQSMEEPKQRKNLWQIGQLGTTPSDVVQGLRVRRTTTVGTTHRKNGRRKWHVFRNAERIAR